MSAISILANPVATLLTDVIDRIFPDKDAQAQQRAELLLKAQEIDAELAKGQQAINEQEAASPSLFVAGWRPFIGWVCGVAFAYHFVLQPLITYVAALNGHKVDLPVFDMQQLSTVLMGMLGLGGLRTVEKLKGVS